MAPAQMGSSGERYLRGRVFLPQGPCYTGDTATPPRGAQTADSSVAHGGYSLCHGLFQNGACVVSGEEGTGASNLGWVSQGRESSSEWQEICSPVTANTQRQDFSGRTRCDGKPQGQTQRDLGFHFSSAFDMSQGIVQSWSHVGQGLGSGSTVKVETNYIGL